MNIVVLTFTHNNNYGSALQCYALTKYLMDQGHTVQQLLVPHLPIPKPYSPDPRPMWRKCASKIKRIMLSPFKFKKEKNASVNPDYIRYKMSEEEKAYLPQYNKEQTVLFESFYNKYIPYFTQPCYTEEDIQKLNLNADLYIVGSDQVWNPSITRGQKHIFFFSFLKNSERRIAFAACAGGSEIWKDNVEDTEKIKTLLSQFNGIGVRGDITMSIMKNTFHINATNVLDPSFLLKADVYKTIAQTSNLNGKGCIFTFKFVINDRWLDIFHKISNSTGKKLIANREIIHLKGIDYEPNLSIEGWLKLIQTSEMVITDSFHCTVFSILFRKQFITTPSYPNGEGRMTAFLSMIGLSDRYFSSSQELENEYTRALKPIDYNSVYKKIDSLREESMSFLQQFI